MKNKIDVKLMFLAFAVATLAEIWVQINAPK